MAGAIRMIFRTHRIGQPPTRIDRTVQKYAKRVQTGRLVKRTSGSSEPSFGFPAAHERRLRTSNGGAGQIGTRLVAPRWSGLSERSAARLVSAILDIGLDEAWQGDRIYLSSETVSARGSRSGRGLKPGPAALSQLSTRPQPGLHQHLKVPERSPANFRSKLALSTRSSATSANLATVVFWWQQLPSNMFQISAKFLVLSISSRRSAAWSATYELIQSRSSISWFGIMVCLPRVLLDFVRVAKTDGKSQEQVGPIFARGLKRPQWCYAHLSAQTSVSCSLYEGEGHLALGPASHLPQAAIARPAVSFADRPNGIDRLWLRNLIHDNAV